MAYRQVDATVAAFRTAAITPNDSTVFEVTRSLYVGTGGTLKVTMADGNDETFYNLSAGYHPLQVKKIYSTTTTASQIIALY